MSDEDIQLISNLLLGISNIDKNIQTNSINNLQNFYKQKYDVFLFCLLNILIIAIQVKNQINQYFIRLQLFSEESQQHKL